MKHGLKMTDIESKVFFFIPWSFCCKFRLNMHAVALQKKAEITGNPAAQWYVSKLK